MKLKYLWVATIAFLLFSCHQNSSHDHNNADEHDHDHEMHAEEADHDHEAGEAESEHEHEKIQYTVYSNDFELFAEADAMVSGEHADVLAHFTSLADFKPLEEPAKITARLIVNGKTITETLNEPLQKGIYSFELKPTTTGEGKLYFDIETKGQQFELVIPDVDVFANDEELHSHHDHGDEPSAINATVFTKEQSWKIDFATALPLEQEFGPAIKTVAKIEPARGEEEIVAAKASGLVLFTNNNLVEGKKVNNGEKLFSISSSEMAENNFAVQLAEAKSNYETNKANYERKSELIKDRLVSEQELLNAKNTYETSKAVYENLSKNFNESGQMVKSKMNGFVKQIFVSNGQYVAAGQPLVSITQNNKLLLTAQVQQKYLSYLPSINTANITTMHDNKSYTLEELNGKILSYGKSASDNSYLFPVNLEIGNHAGFAPGTFVEVFLKTVTSLKAITVPNSALLEEQGIYYVFVQVTPEMFEKREVKIGGTDGLLTEITSGLSTDERIVTQGAMQVKLAKSTGALDPHAGHVH
ncbi:RND family efflux transporter, MFP subunit [Draconibacterium orientale]|uniref:RND family efflux transporter, MFP subunit n=1 Tax=Draconibacterium orientale TaxID=1168034 RepID=X5E0Z6_9BACT|nr:efflux RND transporter periplasmic adaptor subunit [Draconibacterium orientale]AHW61155.1 RND transporter MFP subunit [Draconibacterium orientale]SET34947.1 RND family efflux transporter, MFP subunit [Draconibacterium orientale]